jgi:hypothetical protein
MIRHNDGGEGENVQVWIQAKRMTALQLSHGFIGAFGLFSFRIHSFQALRLRFVVFSVVRRDVKHMHPVATSCDKDVSCVLACTSVSAKAN